MPRTILHIDLDAFFVSVEQVLNPALRGKAVVVGGLSGRGVVASASYEARKFHIRAGMPVITARLLCPDAIFREGNFALYRLYSEKFMDIFCPASRHSLNPVVWMRPIWTLLASTFSMGHQLILRRISGG